MTDHSADIALWSPGSHRGAVRLRTFMTLRAIAVAGQVVAVALVVGLWGVRLPLGPVAAVIAVAIGIGVAAVLAYPPSRRLSQVEVAAFSIFDIAQLSALLFLTGGLSNPFAVLLVGPVAISATVLGLPLTLAVSAAALAAVTALAFYALPILDASGNPLALSPLFILGFWAAICLGIAFVAIHTIRISGERETMIKALAAAQAALERERKLTELGGVVAATAHELGTPLATIRLTATELAEQLPEGEWREDALLIGEQAMRCRDLLRAMGRSGRDDAMMRRAPAGEILREAAEPHAGRGAELLFDLAPDEGGGAEPVIRRSPEIIHGLRNLVQNAVDFAHGEVRLTLRWSPARLVVLIEDDGPGMPADLLERVGEPDLGRRRAGTERRGGRNGMGLGLFIAKTLLERSGAVLDFANAPGGGARARVTWPRHAIEPGAPPAAVTDPPFLP